MPPGAGARVTVTAPPIDTGFATLSWSRALDLAADTAVTVQCESEGTLHIDAGPGTHVAAWSRLVAIEVGSLG